MNIFLVDEKPRSCALALDDLRLNKMVLETAQLLAASCFVVGANIGYKVTHFNHPCAVWARKNKRNFSWLVEYGLELSQEFYVRRRHSHASEEVIKRAITHIPEFPEGLLAFTFNCSGQNSGNIFFDYKECLRKKWASDIKKPLWTRRSPPSWSKKDEQPVLDALSS